MNIRARVERLENSPVPTADETMPDAWNAPVRRWDPSCICFPYKPSFANECELDAAMVLTCPLHGERFTDYEIGYRPKWLAKDAQYAHAPDHVKPQFETAWLVTFPLGYLPV